MYRTSGRVGSVQLSSLFTYSCSAPQSPATEEVIYWCSEEMGSINNDNYLIDGSVRWYIAYQRGMIYSSQRLVKLSHSTMSSSTQDLLPHLDLGNTFGALFIGVTLAAVLVHQERPKKPGSNLSTLIIWILHPKTYKWKQTARIFLESVASLSGIRLSVLQVVSDPSISESVVSDLTVK